MPLNSLSLPSSHILVFHFFFNFIIEQSSRKLENVFQWRRQFLLYPSSLAFGRWRRKWILENCKNLSELLFNILGIFECFKIYWIWWNSREIAWRIIMKSHKNSRKISKNVKKMFKVLRNFQLIFEEVVKNKSINVTKISPINKMLLSINLFKN